MTQKGKLVLGGVGALLLLAFVIHSARGNNSGPSAPASDAASSALSLTCDAGGRTTLHGVAEAGATSWRVTFRGGGFTTGYENTSDWLPVQGGAWLYTSQDAHHAEAEVQVLDGPNVTVDSLCY